MRDGHSSLEQIPRSSSMAPDGLPDARASTRRAVRTGCISFCWLPFVCGSERSHRVGSANRQRASWMDEPPIPDVAED